MARLMRCDECGEIVEPNTIGSSTVVIIVSSIAGRAYPEKHDLCSLECLRGLAAEIMDRGHSKSKE